jgi:putative SOS response-associated peptidase YedK
MVRVCGRFQLKLAEEWLGDLGLEMPDLPPRYNVAPTQEVLAVREEQGRREAALLKWGLVPHWADDPAVGGRLINARAESVARKPAFRDPFKSQRCLVPADGFYEWRRVGRARDPFLFRLADAKTFAFASVWDRWVRKRGRIDSCAVLTTTANELVTPIHDRMPVILPRDAYDLWLDPGARAEDLHALLRPFPAAKMEVVPVSPRVNKADVDDPECERPLAEAPPVPVQGTLF